MAKVRTLEQKTSVKVCLSGHVLGSQLPYLVKLVREANKCGLMVFLDMEQVTALDITAARYLAAGEGSSFRFIVCPSAIRQWIEYERRQPAQLQQLSR